MIGTEMGKLIKNTHQNGTSTHRPTSDQETEGEGDEAKDVEKEENILRAHVPNLPSQEEMKRAITEKKKAALLEKLKR